MAANTKQKCFYLAGENVSDELTGTLKIYRECNDIEARCVGVSFIERR